LGSTSLPFTRRDDGGAVYNGEIVELRAGQDPVCIPTDADGEPVVDASVLRPVDELLTAAFEQLENGSTDKAASMLRDAHEQLRAQLPPAVTPLEPFEIVADCEQQPAARRSTSHRGNADRGQIDAAGCERSRRGRPSNKAAFFMHGRRRPTSARSGPVENRGV